MTEWNNELEKRILKKSRFTLTIRIIRLLIAGLLVYGVYATVLNITFDKLQVVEESDFYTKLALDWKVPNVRGTFDFSEEALSISGTQKISYPLVKRVGKSDIVVGTGEVEKRLLNNNSYIEYRHPGTEQLVSFSFSYPEDPQTGKKLMANPEPNVWQTLDMLHEGTVAELAFSTDRFLTPEELIKILEDYDVDILWMQLHTGEFVNFEPGSFGRDEDSLAVDDAIGLSGARTASDDFLSSSMTYELDGTSIEDSKRTMLENMEALLTKKSSYYEGFLRLGHLTERYKYLNEEGFTVYGAVVTGPVKELIKLENEKIVQGEQLGQVELWNWDNE